MPDAATTTAGGTTTATTTTAAAATPWHTGIDADILGSWQNKNYDLSDPVKVAIEAGKANRQFEKHFGVPPTQLLKLPADTKDEAGWKSVYQRLGAPADAKEYDFAAVKHADGTAPDAGLIETIRSTAAALHIAKDRAPELATAVVKHLDGARTEQAAVAKAALDAERATLQQSWGAKFDFNKLTAMQGAQRLGVTPDEVSKLEGLVGYSRVMEMFRKIGAATGEDTFVEGRPTGGGNPATVEGAQARLNELMADKAWGERLTKGDVAAMREFHALTMQISGYVANAA